MWSLSKQGFERSEAEPGVLEKYHNMLVLCIGKCTSTYFLCCCFSWAVIEWLQHRDTQTVMPQKSESCSH